MQRFPHAFILSLILLALFSYIGSAHASEKTDIPDALDFDRRAADVYRFEIAPYGGDYFGDKLGHTYTVGGDLQVNITKAIGLAVDFGYSRVSVDSTSAVGSLFTNKNEYLLDGALVWNMPAAFRAGRGVMEMDFYTTVGGGVIQLNGDNRIAGFVGGGVKIRPRISWFGIRVEIRNYFTSINNPAGSDFEDDLTLRIGPVFFLPPRL